MRHLRAWFFIAFTTGAASCISLIGGIGLEAVQEKILPLVPLIVALPALNTMVGDYAAIIASHAADPAERRDTKKKLAKAITKAIWVNIIGVLILSTVVAAQRGYLFSGVFVTKFVLFVVFSMIGIVAGMFGLTALLDIILENKRINSDDILIPIVTSITDVAMLGLVVLSAWILF